MIIMLDNCSAHVDSWVEQMIETHNHLIYYLSSYFSDYNSIELTFSVLKIWIWQNYCFIQSAYANFDEFLSSAIEFSHCDWFVHEQFRHAAESIYIKQRVLNSINECIRAYERGIIGDAELVELIDQEADEEADEEANEKEADEKEDEES